MISPDNGLRIASLLDLAGMKAKVVLQRAEAKDYLDIDALLTSGGLDLPTALSAAQAIYGKTYTPLSTLKALSYFDDGNLRQLSERVRRRLRKAVREASCPPSFLGATTARPKERADEAHPVDCRN